MWDTLKLEWAIGLQRLPFFTQRFAVALLGLLMVSLARRSRAAAGSAAAGSTTTTTLAPTTTRDDPPELTVPPVLTSLRR